MPADSLFRLYASFLALLLAVGCCMCATPAAALILAPATIDGPSAGIGEFGGVAVSADGSGGLVYTKQVEGATHVFAAQYVGGHWLAPVRVDWENHYGASYPRIAAADGGQLLVVWVTQIATVDNRIQRALESSTLGAGAGSFGAPFIVDPNVGEGLGVDPSLALAADGQGLVAYRVVTNNFKTTNVLTTIPQLRPGDVLADIRIARYEGELWSSPERVNRDSLLSMRPPSEVNGPQIALGRGDQAVVAWQEPEASGAARIWARRIFGTTLGLVLAASPTSYAGTPVAEDADAFALGVSEFGEAKIVSRIADAQGGRSGEPSLFVNTLPVSTAPTGAKLTGPTPLTSFATHEVGVPSVAVDDHGDYRIASMVAGTARLLVGGEHGAATPELALGPAASATGAGAVTALNPGGGGVTAWPASSASGLGAAVREDFPGGAAQVALLSGAVDGPVSELAVGGSETGESLVGFREGEPGAYEIVGARVSVPPPAFYLELPVGWVKPAKARVSWAPAEDATGGISYSLILDGRIVRRGIQLTSALPDRRLLGSGVRHVQVLATDASGQQTLSSEGELRVDGAAPVATVRSRRGHRVLVRVKDAQSGALAHYTSVSFGDGAHSRGRLQDAHTYAHPGRYVIVVHMRDRVGNETTAHLRVNVR